MRKCQIPIAISQAWASPPTTRPATGSTETMHRSELPSDVLAVLRRGAVIPAALMATSFRFMSFRWLVSPRRDRIWVTVVAVVALVAGDLQRHPLQVEAARRLEWLALQR